MKRILAATILGVGLLGIAGTSRVNKMMADGNPPPPFPPYPPSINTLVADGNPPPPFPPQRPAAGLRLME